MKENSLSSSPSLHSSSTVLLFNHTSKLHRTGHQPQEDRVIYTATTFPCTSLNKNSILLHLRAPNNTNYTHKWRNPSQVNNELPCNMILRITEALLLSHHFCWKAANYFFLSARLASLISKALLCFWAEFSQSSQQKKVEVWLTQKDFFGGKMGPNRHIMRKIILRKGHWN